VDGHLQGLGFHRLRFGLYELVAKLGELLTETQELCTQCDLTLCTGLRRTAPLVTTQVADAFASTWNREAVVVKELTNQHRKLDVFAAVLAMRAASFLGTQRGELGLPVAECVWLDADDVRDLADLEEQLIRQLGAPCHGSNSEPFVRTSAVLVGAMRVEHCFEDLAGLERQHAPRADRNWGARLWVSADALLLVIVSKTASTTSAASFFEKPPTFS